MKAVNTVRNLMTCHDSDSRFAEPECKARVATLYLPLLVIVMDMLPQLHNCNADTRGNISYLPMTAITSLNNLKRFNIYPNLISNLINLINLVIRDLMRLKQKLVLKFYLEV